MRNDEKLTFDSIITIEENVARLSHLDARQRSVAYDNLLRTGPLAITYLMPLLSSKDVDTRIAAFDLCCRLNPLEAKRFRHLVHIDDGDINLAVTVLELLSLHGDCSDVSMVNALVSKFNHTYTDHAGDLAVKEIYKRCKSMD